MKIWEKCARLNAEGADCVVATVIEGASGSPGKSGFKMAVSSTGASFGSVGGGAVEKKTAEAAAEALKNRENSLLQIDLAELGMICGGRMTVFLEFVPAARGFVIFGAGHLGRALSPLLESVGYSPVLFDNREENTAFSGPGRKIIIGDYADIGSLQDEIRKCGRVFIATHGHKHDEILLRQLFSMNIDFQYLGLIGSSRKIAVTIDRLASEGLVPPEAFYAPVGLDIGGDSASEIAIGIAAEVMAVVNGREAVHMRKKAAR